MTATPSDHQSEQPANPAAGPGLPSGAVPLGWPDDADCLTAEQVAELAREEWDLCCPDPDDPEYAEDPEYGPPEWLPYSAADEERMLADEDQRARREVAEAIDAGFTHSAGGNGTGFAAGGPLDVMLPGSDLGWHVIWGCRRGLDTLTDDQLIGLTCANRRQKSLHEAIETDLAAELDRRRTNADGTPGDHVSQELAAALTLTGWSAEALLSLARDLQRLPKTCALLAAGIIDIRRAAVIARHTAVLSDTDAAKVEDMILPRAAAMTTGELSSACLRAVIKVDPQAARNRKEKALKDARVEAWVEDSGTAALAGRDLPPADVIAADKRIDAIARWLKAHGTKGTLDQIRAKVYLALLNDQPLQSLLPGPAGATGAPRPGTPDTSAAETADASGGPATDQASTGTAATDAVGTAGTADATSSVPADGRPAADHASSGSAGSDSAAADHAAADHAGTGCHAAGGAGTGDAGVFGPAAEGPGASLGALGGTVHLTMPYDTWAGRSDNPGDIAGYGAADADTCRDIATRITAAGPTARWCITLTDGNGQPTAHGCARAGPGPPGTTRDPGSWLATVTIRPIETSTCDHTRESAGYQPSPTLRHLIKTRSPRCGSPGCRRPAVSCDDDHTIPYHLGGRTCECNLYPLCRRHHKCKQAPGWHLSQPQPGELIWTTPSGRTYTKISEPYPV